MLSVGINERTMSHQAILLTVKMRYLKNAWNLRLIRKIIEFFTRKSPYKLFNLIIVSLRNSGVTSIPISLYKTSGESISFLPNLYYSQENSYPLAVDGDFNSLQQVEIKDRTEIEATESALQQSLRKDLAKRKISIPKVTKKPPRPKRKPPKKPLKKEAPRKRPKKKKVEKPVVTPTIKVDKPPVLAKKARKTVKAKTTTKKKTPAKKKAAKK